MQPVRVLRNNTPLQIPRVSANPRGIVYTGCHTVRIGKIWSANNRMTFGVRLR
jgi:hypothetical protein